jgi:pimeloyl-ACP methyl ester carboxylesterase
MFAYETATVRAMRPEELTVEGVEMEHRHVDAGGLRMHVALAGAAEGEPVVLLHGWPQHWWIWRGVIPPLVEAGYRVVCPDLRGHGWTDAPPDGYEKEQLATDVLAALDALGVERFRLIGHDWGGFAAFLIALREPERVERLVALSIVHPWIRREGGIGKQLKALLGAAYQFVIASPVVGRQVVQRTGFIKLVIRGGAATPLPDRVRDAYAERWREPERAAATSALYRTFLLRELQPLLGGRYRDLRLTVPTLLLYGSEDPVITADRLAGWEDHADDMAVEEVPGPGHFLPDEQPQLVAERALGHFA